VLSEQKRPIVCGYFAFAHSTALVRGITRARGSFIGGIVDYALAHPLRGVEIRSWHDFGHLQTFFRSRRLVTSARHFNTLRIDGKTAHKSSTDSAKIKAEAAWFTSIPPSLRIFCARLIDSGIGADGVDFYETEYGYLPTLSELFVFGTLVHPAWLRIMRSCHDFLSGCVTSTGTGSANELLNSLAIAKTISRLSRFSDETGFDVESMLRYNGRPMPSLMQIAHDVAEHIDNKSIRVAHVMHGDFCFSNILYDSRVQRIHVIDPRGYVEAAQPTIYGDVRYDLAKLSHSIIGRYDQIIAGRYQISPSDGNRYGLTFEQARHHAWLEDALREFQVDGICAGGAEVRAITIGLFLSMLPLHSDRPDRQQAFVANALRLYADLDGICA
jgi:membrane protein YqaA with SNARE-associated domain